MLRAPARASKGSTSDWPVLSASATSSANEPRGGPMVAKLEPPSQKPTGFSLRADEPLRRRGRQGRGQAVEAEKTAPHSLFLAAPDESTRSSQNEGTGASPTLAASLKHVHEGPRQGCSRRPGRGR